MIIKALGNYNKFFQEILKELIKVNIPINGYTLSHLGYKTATLEEYTSIRDQLMFFSSDFVENIHNGRPISKLILKEPLTLITDFSVSLIELMPPKPNKRYETGLEHLGVVVGEQFDEFCKEHSDNLTGFQDQGPYCKPAFIIFPDGKRVKFYRYSLHDVILMEGKQFNKLNI